MVIVNTSKHPFGTMFSNWMSGLCLLKIDFPVSEDCMQNNHHHEIITMLSVCWPFAILNCIFAVCIVAKG